MDQKGTEFLNKVAAAVAVASKDEVFTQLKEYIKDGQLLFIPFKRGEYAWHVYPMSKKDPKKGYTKRLVSYEQIVAGLAKDPDAIYVHYRAEADKKIEELKKNASSNNQ